jgi:glutathione S-transferase
MPIDPNAPIEVTAYKWVPDLARGFVKDMRVRWALEEIGLPYRERLVGGAGGGDADKSAEHFADQPFGQVPVLKEDGLTLFESGAILIHIGEKDERLLPQDPAARKRAIGWMIAALNSVEPFAQTLFLMGHVAQDKEWQSEAKAAVRPFAQMRLAQLSDVLGEHEWLEDRFTIGDLVMIDVLRAVSEYELVTAHPNLAAYVDRGTSRPAFRTAMAAQLAAFDANEPVAA